MVRYNHSEIITHRTLYTCLTHTFTAVEVHHIISSIVQFAKCQLIVSIYRPYINDTNTSSAYTCVSNYIYTILYIYVMQFNN
jgi:hypothetical protein